MNLLKNVKIDQILGYFSAGTAKRTSDIIDMANYEGAMFIFLLGTIIATGTLDCYLEGNDANSTSGMARLAGQTAHTVTSADAALTQSAIVVDIYNPDPTDFRYLQANITPAAQNAVILGITVIRYNGKVKPDANAALLEATQLISPAAA